MTSPTLLSVAAGLLALGLLFGLVERVFRRGNGPPWWRRPDMPTDLAFGFATPLLSRVVTRIAVVAVAAVLIVLSGSSLSTVKAEVDAGRLPDLSVLGMGHALRSLPFAVEVVLGFLLADLVGYGWHRLFHRRPLWPFHAVHHSSTRLDWLSSVRVHPVNDLVTRVGQAVPILLVGFEPRVFFLFAPVTTLYAILLHADVGWTYGPLRYVIASPAFHRWHHAADREALGKNFAGLFPAIDLAFGTFHLPVGVRPKALGIAGDPVPRPFLSQLAWPFRAGRPEPNRAAGAAPTTPS